jgi:hypothetical protein
VAATHEPVNPIARYFLSLTKPPQLPSEPKEFSNADLRGARFTDTDLSGSSFQEVSFQYARLRGVDFVHAEIWGAIAGLVINGVEIEPLIEAELERRFPAGPRCSQRTRTVSARRGRPSRRCGRRPSNELEHSPSQHAANACTVSGRSWKRFVTS